MTLIKNWHWWHCLSKTLAKDWHWWHCQSKTSVVGSTYIIGQELTLIARSVYDIDQELTLVTLSVKDIGQELTLVTGSIYIIGHELKWMAELALHTCMAKRTILLLMSEFKAPFSSSCFYQWYLQTPGLIDCMEQDISDMASLSYFSCLESKLGMSDYRSKEYDSANQRTGRQSWILFHTGK